MHRNLTWQGFLLRWLFAIILVFLTWNPHGLSFLDYVLGAEDITADWPLKLILGIALLIGWVIYMRATLSALGAIGMALVVALFAAVIAALNYYELVTIGFNGLFVDLVLLFISLLLAVGMSWSHIRRRLSGQVDVDDIDD